MAAEQSNEKDPEDLLKLEQALSDRSTCRATGDKIKKGEWRVGIEAWRAGRQSMTWQKADAFLKNCFLEECTKGNSGTCKLCGHKFAKGEVRFVFATGDKKMFLTIPSAAKVIQPVIDVCGGDFATSDMKGLNEIPAPDQELYHKEFKSSQAERAKTKRQAPESTAAEDAKATPPKAKRRRGKQTLKVKEEEDTDEEEDVEEEDDSEMPGSQDGVKKEEEGEESDDDEEGEKEEEEEEDGEEEPASPNSPGVPAYEKERQAIMARNREKMQLLGIQQLAADIMPQHKPKPRSQTKGLAARKKKVPYEGPRRTSLRQKGVTADGRMVDTELRGGHVTFSHDPNAATKTHEYGKPAEPEAPKERHPKEALPFESDNGDKDMDEKFLKLLKAASTGTTKGEKGKTELHKLDLDESNVAKVTNNGISHIQWHPSSSHLILAAADKSGNVGLWNLASQKKASQDEDSVLAFSPHNSYVSGLRWAGTSGAPKLYTGSYDGSVRCLDPTTGKFELLVSSEEAEFSAMDCTADGSTAILGDNDGYLHVFDIRENAGKQRKKEAELHNKRINTLHFAPGDEHLFVSSSSDNSLAVWDLRKLSDSGKLNSLASGVHSKTCQSAYFAPDGSKRVVSLSRDDTVQIWQYNGKSSLGSKVSIRHYNNTGRWILPFRATWSPSADAIVVGNMKRKVDILSADGGELGALQSDHMTAISSRAAVHPDLGFLAASTASGRVHVFK